MKDYNEGELNVSMIDESLSDWVITKCDNWRDHYEALTIPTSDGVKVIRA